jgi:very-short-patch-repair endonuclease
VDKGPGPLVRCVRVVGVEVVEALHRCGGAADLTTLSRLSSRRRLRRALANGTVVRVGTGRYALPTAHVALVAAHRVRGVISHRSAAAWWGWELKTQPPWPDITVPKHRRCDRRGVELHWSDLDEGEVREGVVTSRERTLVDCARTLPFDEALAVADSALRREDISPDTLQALARDARGPGSARIRRVAARADGRAANPFESVLRAIAIDEGLQVTPQLVVHIRDGEVRPDLVDQERGLVLEADSFEWHGSRSALRRDCRRYNALVQDGWIVLRFAWEDVMHDQDYVRAVLRSFARTATRTQRGRHRSWAS